MGYETSRVKCGICSYKWTAVRPINTDKLECPHCGRLYFYEVIPVEIHGKCFKCNEPIYHKKMPCRINNKLYCDDCCLPSKDE